MPPKVKDYLKQGRKVYNDVLAELCRLHQLKCEPLHIKLGIDAFAALSAFVIPIGSAGKLTELTDPYTGHSLPVKWCQLSGPDDVRIRCRQDDIVSVPVQEETVSVAEQAWKRISGEGPYLALDVPLAPWELWKAEYNPFNFRGLMGIDLAVPGTDYTAIYYPSPWNGYSQGYPIHHMPAETPEKPKPEPVVNLTAIEYQTLDGLTIYSTVEDISQWIEDNNAFRASLLIGKRLWLAFKSAGYIADPSGDGNGSISLYTLMPAKRCDALADGNVIAYVANVDEEN